MLGVSPGRYGWQYIGGLTNREYVSILLVLDRTHVLSSIQRINRITLELKKGGGKLHHLTTYVLDAERVRGALLCVNNGSR